MKRNLVGSRSLRIGTAAIALAIAFVALNRAAYDGFFQADELNTLTWAPLLPASVYIEALVSPKFQADNFRPTGHLYFALMGRAFPLDFPPYITPIFVIHLVNALLLYLLIRKLGIEPWRALAATTFFALTASACDAYWKPMYVFDLLCTTFSLAAILLYADGHWVLSFVAFWLAYKAKEPAVMLPAILAVYEYWFGPRKFQILVPFLIASLSFGIQGLMLNPNHDNDYSFRFTLDALRHTVPFYARRLLMFPVSGLLLFVLALVPDRRIWFGLAAMCLVLFPLLFLPGRLFEAYVYLPLAFATVALASAASHAGSRCAWIALIIWMPFNVRILRAEARATLATDDQIYAFVNAVGKWSIANPSIRTFVFDGAPQGFGTGESGRHGRSPTETTTFLSFM